MEKNNDRFIWGIILGVIGLIIIILNNFWYLSTNISLMIGLPFVIIGLIIILNKSEDTIEKRKDINK